jgi:hypothetical protein
MKIQPFALSIGVLLLGLSGQPFGVAQAATTIDATKKFAYGANVGWVDWRGNTNQGAVIGEYVCSGYLYAANLGWIHLGSNAPANGIQYQNNSAADYGVNHDGQGNLRGYAWGANIGWVNFESIGGAKVDLTTGGLTGSVYSANCGWISLSNAFAFVQTDTIVNSVDTDGDGIADAWERLKFGNLTTANATSDFDDDGVSDRDEYLADTNPKDATSRLAITAFDTPPGGMQPSVTWNSVLTQQYHLEKALSLVPPSWFDSGLGLILPDGNSTTRSFADTNAPTRFYRVRAVKPLAP